MNVIDFIYSVYCGERRHDAWVALFNRNIDVQLGACGVYTVRHNGHEVTVMKGNVLLDGVASPLYDVAVALGERTTLRQAVTAWYEGTPIPYPLVMAGTWVNEARELRVEHPGCSMTVSRGRCVLNGAEVPLDAVLDAMT